MADEKEIAKILKEALKIVDELASCEIEEIVNHRDVLSDREYEKLDELIEKAGKLKKNRLWKLT